MLNEKSMTTSHFVKVEEDGVFMMDTLGLCLLSIV